MNTSDIQIIMYLLATHWVADFVLQSDKMAKGKSTSNKWLGIHVLVYAVCFIPSLSIGFVLLNGAIHFVVDWFTSRQSSRLWAEGRVHDFFVVIGFDQLIHALTLIVLADIFLF